MNMRIASITACNAEFFFYSYLGLLPLQSTKFSKYLSQIMSDSYVRRHAAELKEGRIKHLKGNKSPCKLHNRYNRVIKAYQRSTSNIPD